MAGAPSDVVAAARRWGHLVDPVARKYRNPVTGGRLSGAALLLKLAKGENGFGDKGVSSVGARGYTQFMPATRADYIRRYGVDPWKDANSAFHATAIYLRHSGNIASYNPGMSTYTDYILGQKIGHIPGLNAPGRGGGGGGSRGGGAGGSVGAPAGQSGLDVGQASTAVLDVLGQLQGGGVSQPVASAPAAPSFSAHALLPQGYSAPAPSSGGVQSKPDISGLLALIKSDGTVAGTQGGGSGSAGGGGGGGGSSSQGGAATGPVAKGFHLGSPVPGQQRHGSTHPTAGLPGYPAYDYMAPAGTAALAPVTGRVVKLSGHDPRQGPPDGPHGPFGWSVYIRGNDGRTYYLTHMGARNVRVGQAVKAGQRIGAVGNYAKWGGADHIHMGVHG